MPTDCLVLTPWMQPHQTVSWQEAVTLVYTKKGQPIEHYDEFVSSPSTTIQLPAVIRLKMMIATMKSDVKFSRINVYTRDGFRCQYCRVKKPMKGLNYDHVIPRAHGGKTSWENIVTSCIACNLKKGLHDAGTGRYALDEAAGEAGQAPDLGSPHPEVLERARALVAVSPKRRCDRTGRLTADG